LPSRIRIAVDLMGGDSGLRLSLPAALKSLSHFSDLDITLVGDQTIIASEFARLKIDPHNLHIVHAADTVLMTDKPSVALRRKPQSSMRVAIDLLQQREVDAVVSSGNTGALMAIGCYVLKTLPGIDRPAICSSVPTLQGHCYLLDLGANVDSSAENLQQFALMGSAMCSAVDGIERPRVALLNIGEEDIKGNEQVKLAGKLIEDNEQLNYMGFIEGSELFQGNVDVVVCDGFVGNVALKVCEGTAGYISTVLKTEFSSTPLARFRAMLVRPILKRIVHKLNPEQYNGASFLGLQGVVVKSHGHSSAEGFQYAIAQAYTEVKGEMLKSLDNQLSLLNH
jgi:glycerol-3-phosphate acyltransferase PlsX